jgi:hypothetical protein
VQRHRGPRLIIDELRVATITRKYDFKSKGIQPTGQRQGTCHVREGYGLGKYQNLDAGGCHSRTKADTASRAHHAIKALIFTCP